MLDLTKPLELSDGRPARLLASDLKGGFPIVVAVPYHEKTDEEDVWEFRRDGTLAPDLFLRNRKPKGVTLKRWVRVWKNVYGEWEVSNCLFHTKIGAEGINVLAVPIEITFTEE